MSSITTVSPANTLVGSANERALDAPSRSWCRFVFAINLWSSRFLASRRQEVHPIDDRVNEIPIFASLRRLLQMDTKFASGDADSTPYTDASFPWCHGKYKCAEIRRSESTEDVLRVRMYETFTRVTIFLPDDFHGVVQRLGHSGRSISCSREALYLKESNNLRFTGAADGTEDEVLVRTEKILHVCVAGYDAPVARTGRIGRNSR